MKLIDFLVKELPKRGGWPNGAVECCWHRGDDNLDFYDETGNFPQAFSNVDLYDFNLEGVNYKATGMGVQEILKSEYEEALADYTRKFNWDGKGLPPVGAIVQGLPFDALSYEKPFMFTVDVIHDGCFIGEALAGGKVYGEFSNWKITPILSEEEKRRDQVISDINTLIGDIEKYPTWKHAVCGIYDAIAAGNIKGLKVE